MGYDAKVVLGGNVQFGVRSISIDSGADPHEVGDTESGRYKITAAGRFEARVSMQLFEDGVTSYYDGGLELQQGSVIDIKYFPRGNPGVFWRFPYFLVTQVSHKTDVNNPNDISISGVSVGEYVRPA
jgi:hypothetical protein